MAKKKMTLEEKLEEAIVKDVPYEVPENWIWVKLNGGFADCLDKFRKPINSTERANRVGEIPYYGATGQVGFIDDYLTNENLVLVGEDGAPFFDILKNKSYIIDGKAWVNNHAHILKSYYGVTGNKYLMNYLNVFNYNDFVNGTTRLKLTQASMNSIPVPLPPLKEQQRIVDKIESLFEKLDRANELIEEARDDFEKRKSAILEKAFRGELTKKWREEHSSNKISEELLVKFNVNGKFSNVDIEGIVLPNSWVWTQLENVCKNIGDVDHKMPKDFEDGIPYISPRDFNGENEIDFENSKKISQDDFNRLSKKIKPENNDIIFARYGTVGVTRFVNTNIDFLASYSCAIIKTEKLLMNPKYTYYYTKTQICYDEMKRYINETTQKNVGIKSIKQFNIPIAPLEEQDEIVRILDKVLVEESKIEELTQLEKQIELIKKSILAKAFRGQLGTNCEEDESALELLKEILNT